MVAFSKESINAKNEALKVLQPEIAIDENDIQKSIQEEVELVIDAINNSLSNQKQSDIQIFKIFFLVENQSSVFAHSELESLWAKSYDACTRGRPSYFDLITLLNILELTRFECISKTSKIYKFIETSTFDQDLFEQFTSLFVIHSFDQLLSVFECLIENSLNLCNFEDFRNRKVNELFAEIEFCQIEKTIAQITQKLSFKKLENTKLVEQIYSKTLLNLEILIEEEINRKTFDKIMQEKLILHFKTMESRFGLENIISANLSERLNKIEQKKVIEFFDSNFNFFSENFLIQKILDKNFLSQFEKGLIEVPKEEKEKTLLIILENMSSQIAISSQKNQQKALKRQMESLIYDSWIEYFLSRMSIDFFINPIGNVHDLEIFSTDEILIELNLVCKMYLSNEIFGKIKNGLVLRIMSVCPKSLQEFSKCQVDNSEMGHFQENIKEFFRIRKTCMYIWDYVLVPSESYLQKYNIDKMKNDYLKTWC